MICTFGAPQVQHGSVVLRHGAAAHGVHVAPGRAAPLLEVPPTNILLLLLLLLIIITITIMMMIILIIVIILLEVPPAKRRRMAGNFEPAASGGAEVEARQHSILGSRNTYVYIYIYMYMHVYIYIYIYICM